jgi:hypothetical protein
VARKCIFCEKKAGSGEHMFPDWLNGVFSQVEWQTTDTPQWSRGTQDFRTHEVTENVWGANEIASLRLKKLCHTCNTGWMADLESAAEPLLAPVILGRPTTLNQDEQITIATWATKTVMVCEASMSDEQNFPIEDRKIVMNENRPPGHLRVFAAALEGLITPARFGAVRLEVQQHGSHLGDLHLYTLQLNLLVLQVVRQVPPAPVAVVMSAPDVAWESEVRVFPPVPAPPGFFWPPKKSFDPDGLPRYMTRHNNPPPLLGP